MALELPDLAKLPNLTHQNTVQGSDILHSDRYLKEKLPATCSTSPPLVNYEGSLTLGSEVVSPSIKNGPKAINAVTSSAK